MTENRKVLDSSDLDGFDKRKLPSPGFQIEVVMIDYDGTLPARSMTDSASKGSDGTSGAGPASGAEFAPKSSQSKVSAKEDNDDVFSDSEEEDTQSSESREAQAAPGSRPAESHHLSKASSQHSGMFTSEMDQLSLQQKEPAPSNASKKSTANGIQEPSSGFETPNMESAGASEIKAIAADASVFSFGDEEEFDSE